MNTKLHTPRYKLKQVAQLTGISTHSIRQYVDKGLVVPLKTESNRHIFSEIDLLRLNRIKMLIVNEGLNIAGIKALDAMVPCWELKPCSERERDGCGALRSTDQPCWEVLNKGIKCKDSICRTCEVYCYLADFDSVKDLYANLLLNNK